MRIHFLGATRTTTGSMYLFEINGRQLLLECGLFQGKREESMERNRRFPFDPAKIDAVVLSHAHIDHCGNLPNLCRQGFNGNIYSTFATRDLVAIMLEDSAEIQRDDAAFVSKKRVKQGLPPVEPLYTATDAEKAVRQFVAINYDRPFPVADGVTVTFRDAGHILGAAQVVFDIREGNRTYRYLFSGDIGRGNDDILRDPQRVENVDYLQVESTYGGREHSPKANADVTVYFGEAPVSDAACAEAEKQSPGHCDTFHAKDETYFKDVWYWNTPTKSCLDGRGDVCTDFDAWTRVWTEVTGG
jgi:metallo-beta-lactamase family protein